MTTREFSALSSMRHVSDTQTSSERHRARAVVALVNAALDDIEAERLDIANALRLVAEQAWVGGERVALRAYLAAE
jgi:hypothetical protein